MRFSMFYIIANFLYFVKILTSFFYKNFGDRGGARTHAAIAGTNSLANCPLHQLEYPTKFGRHDWNRTSDLNFIRVAL